MSVEIVSKFEKATLSIPDNFFNQNGGKFYTVHDMIIYRDYDQRFREDKLMLLKKHPDGHLNTKEECIKYSRETDGTFHVSGYFFNKIKHHYEDQKNKR